MNYFDQNILKILTGSPLEEDASDLLLDYRLNIMEKVLQSAVIYESLSKKQFDTNFMEDMAEFKAEMKEEEPDFEHLFKLIESMLRNLEFAQVLAPLINQYHEEILTEAEKSSPGIVDLVNEYITTLQDEALKLYFDLIVKTSAISSQTLNVLDLANAKEPDDSKSDPT